MRQNERIIERRAGRRDLEKICNEGASKGSRQEIRGKRCKWRKERDYKSKRKSRKGKRFNKSQERATSR